MPKLIGGSAHGKIYEVRQNDIVIESLVNPRPLFAYSAEDALSAQMVDIKREVYKRAKIMGETQVFEVFIPEDWDGDRLIEELIRRA